MKVSGTGTTGATGSTKRAGKTERSSGAFARLLSESSDVEEASAPDGASPVTGIDALLAAQSVGDATDGEGKKRAVQRGEDILDRLEEIRHGLLLGAIPKERLLDLAHMVRNRRDTVSDPRLASLLDEIELRAEVEIAKLTRQG